MASKKISELASGSPALSGIVPVTNASGTLTEKITLGSILNLAPVQSVAGRQGAISLDHRDIGNLPTTLSQFVANQNDLNLGNGGIIRISSDAARDVTGFVATSAGDARLLSNVGNFTITLKHNNTSSVANNRILCVGGTDVTISAGGSAAIYYDGVDSRWRVG